MFNEQRHEGVMRGCIEHCVCGLASEVGWAYASTPFTLSAYLVGLHAQQQRNLHIIHMPKHVLRRREHHFHRQLLVCFGTDFSMYARCAQEENPEHKNSTGAAFQRAVSHADSRNQPSHPHNGDAIASLL